MDTPHVVFIDTLMEGRVPAVRNAEGKPFIFASLREAQQEIAVTLMDRLQEFLDGEREFEEAISLDEFVLPVSLTLDGNIVDTDGNPHS